MKKIIYILIILTLIILINVKTENVMPVMDYDTSDYITGYLFIPGLTTKTIGNYFDSNNIVALYPYINPLYKSKINYTYFPFTYESIKINIDRFTNYYKRTLDKNNLSNELININYSGIKIEKLKVIILSSELNKMLRNCKDCYFEQE